MKLIGSERFSLDIKNLIQVGVAFIIGTLSIYVYNQEAVNSIIGNYVDGQTLTVIVMVLSYLAKKYTTNYSITNPNGK